MSQRCKCAPALQLSLDGPRRNDPRYPGAQEAMNAWFVVMIILLGIVALTLHRYDVWLWRVLTWIALGWFVLASTCEARSGRHRARA
jgi:hypothetical protein